MPPRMSASAWATPYANPAHAAFVSYAAAGFAPMRSATIAETEGVCRGLLMVATITVSMSEAARPERSTASRAASVASSTAVVSRTARTRVTMPVRWRIHSSLESIGPTRSSLGTRFSPRAAPYA